MKSLLLFASLVLSIYASAQTKQINAGLLHPAIISQENVRGFNEDTGWQISGINSEYNMRQTSQLRTTSERSLIQLNDSIYHWNWDTLNLVYQNDEKTTDILYDEDNNVISETHQIWKNNGWTCTYKTNTNYDDKNNPINILHLHWNDSIWEPDYRLTFTYNENNKRLSQLEEDWNGSLWEISSLNSYTYDENDYLISFLEQYCWGNSELENAFLFTFSYDSAYNYISQLEQRWNDSIWGNYCLYTYSYDDNNRKVNRLYQEWDGIDWVNDNIYIYTYDSNNNVISKLYQNWNGPDWVNSNLSTFIYDANNYITSDLLQNWYNNTWNDWMLRTYTYDEYYNLNVELMQRWFINDWVNFWCINSHFDDNNFLESGSFWRWELNGTVEGGDSSYYYFHTVVGINEVPESLESISVYPNPASTIITFSTPTKPEKNTILTIIDITGKQLIMRQITEKQTVVDVSGLSQGVYFVRVADDRAVRVSKFIKQ